jgi:hypothetical protein
MPAFRSCKEGTKLIKELPAHFDQRAQALSNSFRRFCEVPSSKRVTISLMILAIFGIRLLEFMFFAGLVGSAVVVLISFVEDFKELFGEE